MTISLERLNTHFSRGEDPKTIGGIPLVADVQARMKCWKFDDRVATQTTSADGTSIWSRNVERWKLSPQRQAVEQYDDPAPSVSVADPEVEDDDDDTGDPGQDERNQIDEEIEDLAPKDDVLQILQLLQEHDDAESDDLLAVARGLVAENRKWITAIERYSQFHSQVRNLLDLKGPGLLDDNADETLVALANMRSNFERLKAASNEATALKAHETTISEDQAESNKSVELAEQRPTTDEKPDKKAKKTT